MSEFCLTALAAWRLAHLLVYEDGPADLFARLRYWAGVRWVAVQGPDGRPGPTRVATTPLAKGLTCLWCVSVWTAAALRLCRGNRLGLALRDVLAVSAGALVVHEVLHGGTTGAQGALDR